MYLTKRETTCIISKKYSAGRGEGALLSRGSYKRWIKCWAYNSRKEIYPEQPEIIFTYEELLRDYTKNTKDSSQFLQVRMVLQIKN